VCERESGVPVLSKARELVEDGRRRKRSSQGYVGGLMVVT